MANVGKTGVVRFEDTLAHLSIGTGLVGVAGNTYNTEDAYGIAWHQNCCTGATPFSRAVSATKGLHLAGSTNGTDDDAQELIGNELMFYGQTGQNAIDCLFQVDTAATVAWCFGLTGQVAGSASVLPVELSATTWASTGSDFCGLVYNTDATNDEVHCFWVDDSVDTTESLANLRMQGAEFVKDKWAYLRVETQDRGSGNSLRATFHYEQDGKTFEKVFNTSMDRDQAMAWYLGIQNKAGLAHGIYVKLPGWEQSIAD